MTRLYRRLAEPAYPDRWGRSGPPEEAYSRTTDLERFKPLHAFAEGVLSQLENVFNVTRTTASASNLEFPPSDILSAVRLSPADPAAASIIVGMTSFPGLRLRCGYGVFELFPACGCDACSETAGSEAYRFESMVVAVVEGGLTETIMIPVIGAAQYKYELRTESTREGRSATLPRSRARELIRQRGRRVEWRPWPTKS